MKHKPNYNQIQEGDKVKLGEHTEYDAQSTNPKMGSKYECVGTVCEIHINNDPYAIYVNWENGEGNSYRHSDLVLLDTGFISIWGEDESLPPEDEPPLHMNQ